MTCVAQGPLAIIAVALATAAAVAVPAGPALGEPHTFELRAPDAQVVYLAGEMSEWDKGKRPMRRDADGLWRLTVDLGPGEWLYKFIVDGRWIADPESPDHDADGQGGQHSFLFVGSGDWNPQPGVPQGRIETRLVDSSAWGQPLKVNVYLPPGFTMGGSYPVLWLLHGGGMDADQWLKTGRVNRYADNLIGRGAIHPMVIVMPSSGGLPYTGASERFVTQELTAWLAATYGLRTVRSRSAVAGMSMGGFGAVYLPLRHPDLYGFSLALSGYFDDDFIAGLPDLGQLPMPVRLLCGRDDRIVIRTNRRLVSALKAHRWDFYYREDAGGHTWQYWSNRMVELLTSVDGFFASAAGR
jgi:enterochelin esterase-like enzyme